jgi:hypothetical protein
MRVRVPELSREDPCWDHDAELASRAGAVEG